MEFHKALAKHSIESGRHGEQHAYWICTFANSQHHVDLGHGHWQWSPFNVALESHHCESVVMVLDLDAVPLTRIWCIFEMFRCTVLEHPLQLYTADGIVTAASIGSHHS